jgi:hypothetical protein
MHHPNAIDRVRFSVFVQAGWRAFAKPRAGTGSLVC